MRKYVKRIGDDELEDFMLLKIDYTLYKKVFIEWDYKYNCWKVSMFYKEKENENDKKIDKVIALLFSFLITLLMFNVVKASEVEGVKNAFLNQNDDGFFVVVAVGVFLLLLASYLKLSDTDDEEGEK